MERLVPKTTTVQGTRRYLGIDLDHDGRQDVVALGCPAALKARNQCVIEVSPSSGGGYSIQEAHTEVVRFKGSVFVVSGELGPQRPVGTGKILRLTAKAPVSACAGL